VTHGSDDYIHLEEKYSAHNYHPLDVVLTEGNGVWVYDVDGNKYLDCLSAYSAVNQGHCHPRILQAAQDQMQRMTLTSRAFRNDQMGPFLKQLCELSGYEKALPMNTGAEAVETAIKAARKWGYVVKGRPRRPGRDHRLPRQLPRPHHDHRRLLQRGRLPRQLRPLHPRLRHDPLRRHRRARGGDHPQHRRLPRRADPG
jgi:hypothetical protein